MHLLIVGNREGTNIGGCFERCAVELGHQVDLAEAQLAMVAPTWLRRLNWHLRDHRPTRLVHFSNQVIKLCAELKPDVLLAVGLAPIMRSALDKVRLQGVITANYLTDDPWNRSFGSRWFFESLSGYDVIASPRQANLADLRRHGCHRVEYLPFGYDPKLHFAEAAGSVEEARQYESDIVFIGGADQDRIPFAYALHEGGLKTGLYGGDWGRYRKTRHLWSGYADVRMLRLATAGSKISLCLVKRANRDGHTMRTFEAAAMGACLLVEDTEEHREIFGTDGEAVIYFNSIREMVERARWLLDHPLERQRLARTVKTLITCGQNTYKDRLETILKFINKRPPMPAS